MIISQMLKQASKVFFSEAVKKDQEEAQAAIQKFIQEYNENAIDKTTKTIIVDYSKCDCHNNCTNCAQICDKRIFAFSKVGDNAYLQISTAQKLAETNCNKCGQCALYCPTGAISIKNDIKEVKEYLSKKEFKHSVIFFDSAVVSVLKEITKEEISPKRLVALLHKAGFEYVFNGDIAEDIFVVEESEQLNKSQKEHKILISSHCPAFTEILIKKHGEQALNHISPVKTPINLMTSAIKKVIDDPFIVSCSCCSAAKEHHESNFHLTTKELAELIKDSLKSTKEEEPFNEPFVESSGAAAICGTSGGLTESIMRTVTNADTQYEYHSLRNFEEPARLSMISDKLVCVTTGDYVGTDVSRRIFDNDKVPENICYLEGTSCPGGCLNGGGNVAIQDVMSLKARYSRVYQTDRKSDNRCSHLNPTLKKLYKELFDDEKPGNKKAIELFHEQ